MDEMIIKKTYLFSRNARDKVQLAKVVLVQKVSTFYLYRTTGQLDGKHTEQPTLFIEKGKAKRSVLEQALLQYNSIVSKYKDKGYKELSDFTNKSFEELSIDEISSFIPVLKTDTNGNLKHMLAKDASKCAISIYNNEFYCSKKLNGVRCSFGFNKETQEIYTVSRGGKNYDISTKHLQNELLPLFKINPDVIFDGELYIHGTHLQTISGLARLKTWDENCEKLEYWIYDIMDGNKTTSERVNDLLFWEDKFSQLNGDSSKIKFLEHHLISGWEEIERTHNKWVEEGYEGLIGRKINKTYEFGKRTSTMIKVKVYKDDEFLIVDWKEGLRLEDFVFICETPDKKLFSAKPTGSKELKEWYLENINSIIGEYGKVMFFEYSLEGIPVQPVFKCVRYTEDINLMS